MAILSLLRGALGLEETAIENVTKDPDGSVVFHVRPMARQRGRCGRCRRRSPRYDPGAGRRRWRTLDHGVAMAFLEADAPRVRCRIPASVPRLFRSGWSPTVSVDMPRERCRESSPADITDC